MREAKLRKQLARELPNTAAPAAPAAVDETAYDPARGFTVFVDEGLLSFCLPILILYGDFPLEEQIVVTNDSAPSYIHRPAGAPRACC